MTPRRILLVGSNGLLGQKTAELLVRGTDHQVLLASAEEKPVRPMAPAEYVRLDITSGKEVVDVERRPAPGLSRAYRHRASAGAAGCARGLVSDPRPIGVFDSGVGGLTVAAALSRALPGESILYLGDTARLPYGTKSELTVARYTQTNVDFLASYIVNPWTALYVGTNADREDEPVVEEARQLFVKLSYLIRP